MLIEVEFSSFVKNIRKAEDEVIAYLTGLTFNILVQP